MSAEITFFSTDDDEARFIDYVLATGDVVPIPVRPVPPDVVPVVDVQRRPDWPASWMILFWLRSAGRLRWLRSHRKPGEPRSPSLVDDLVTPAVLRLIEPPPGRAFVDSFSCPVMRFERGSMREGLIGPARLYVVADSMPAVSEEFARWVRRCFAWIRRRSHKVEDLRALARTSRSTFRLPWTLWAMPEAHEEIGTDKGRFASFY